METLIKIAKNLLSVVVVGAVLYVLYTYGAPAYESWHAPELWISEYGSISWSVVTVCIIGIGISILALLFSTKWMKG